MRQALGVQLRVIYALMVRQISSSFGDLRWGYLWEILGPALVVVGLSFLFEMFGRRSVSGVPILMFMLNGWMTFQFFIGTSQAVGQAIQRNLQLLAYPQVTPVDTVLAVAVMELLTHSAAFAVACLIAFWIGEYMPPHDLGRAVEAIVLTWGVGCVWGLAVMFLLEYVPEIGEFDKLIKRFLFFTSGIFFAASELPWFVVQILAWNPLFHLIEAQRTGWFAGYEQAWINLWYPGLIIFVGLFLAFAFERIARDRTMSK